LNESVRGLAAFTLAIERSSPQHHRTPVPLQRWHFTTLSPFLSKPLPSQFLHFCFFLMFGPFSLVMRFSCRWNAVDWCFVGAALGEGDIQTDANYVAIFIQYHLRAFSRRHDPSISAWLAEP
jgi:hypothetical protein